MDIIKEAGRYNLRFDMGNIEIHINELKFSKPEHRLPTFSPCYYPETKNYEILFATTS